MAFYFIFLIINFMNIKAFLIISIDIKSADDCVRKIELGNNLIFQKDSCHSSRYEVIEISYEIGQTLHIEVNDSGGIACSLKAIIDVYNINNITMDKNEFWWCENCASNYIFDNNNKMLRCYSNIEQVNNEKRMYNFYFKINTFSQLGLTIPGYYYYLTDKNYFFISSPILSGKIDLIDLSSLDNLYVKIQGQNKQISDYKYIYYKLILYKFILYEGKFYGSDESDNDIILSEETYSKISQTKSLKYELSNYEKEKNGAHIRLGISIFHNFQNQIEQVSAPQEFNFFICLEGYQFCDLETSLKCLKEGYYQINDRYYSCYETCKTCNIFKKPDTADYFNNYCDECKEEYSYYINLIDNENGREYKSCYIECPPHAPILKEYGKKECVSYCSRYKTSDGRCVDSCDHKYFKYLLKNESKCYNYIPDNYFIFIDDYTENYANTDIPIIKLGETCPDDTYDSSFNNYCINMEEDIFYFIKNPNELITYNNPFIKKLETKEIIIRGYSSDKKLDNINNNDKLIQIDISNCENKIRTKYQISNEKLLIFYDAFNMKTGNYFYRIFTKEGEELDYTSCNSEDIIIRDIIYNIQKPENATECPEDFPYLQLDTNKCMKKCEIMSFINQDCITDHLTEDNQMKDINNIKKAIEDHSIDFLIDNITKGGNDITIVGKNIKYQISSSWNQNDIDNGNISNIKLGNCENILKEKYNIPLDAPLIILKLDIDVEGYLTPSVEYEVYNPVTKEKLNLKYCEDEQIEVLIPVSIDENELFKYNPNSEFYNDICSTYTTNFKTDITLKDRQNEFLNKNMTLCESGCNFASYNSNLKKVECKCDVKYRIKDLSEIKIDKDKLKKNFNFKNLINLKVLKCYKKVFTKIGLFYNIGSYILLSIIFLYIISMIYLILKDYSLLKSEIEDVFNVLQINKSQNDIEIKEIKNKNNQLKIKQSISLVKKNLLENDIKYPPSIYNKLIKNDKILSYYHKQHKNKNNIKNVIYPEKSNSTIIKRMPEINYTEFELNNSSYKIALLYDKRLFWKYFFSLVKFEHLLFFAIVPSKDYNSRAIKICIFLFTFALFFADNAIFMNEDAIHNIYENHGTFDFIYQIPQIIYSNIISFIIDKLIRFLSLSQDYVTNVKMKSKATNKINIIQQFFNVLFIKYIFFYIITFLFLFFFWFYIACFCYVYRNTQIYLIKDTMFSFGLSLITPFVFYFFSSILRICSLNKRNRNILYILSQWILF